MAGTEAVAHALPRNHRVARRRADQSFKESILVSIHGGETTVELGESVTLSAEIRATTGNPVFSWYINGRSVGYGLRQIIISGDVVGSYRIDLLVVSPEGSDGGMATTWVRTVPPAPS